MSKNANPAAAKRGRPPRFTAAQVIAALEASAGIAAAAARLLRCDAKTLKGYIQRDPEISEALADIIEDRLDAAEASLLKLMTDSTNPHAQLNACMFYLRTKGKDRGYTFGAEVTGKNGGALETGSRVVFNLAKFSVEDLEELERHALISVSKPTVAR